MPATYNEIQKKKTEKKSQSKLKIKCGMDKQIKQILKKNVNCGIQMVDICVLYLYCYIAITVQF